ncbi:MAG: N-acetylmuramic acid 6-phosphate etherase [Rhizobiaceae bacterium]|nr:N-acetylmuramic acid 6-phosphate etherase [Rhizobiaceae bacterium]
MVVSGTESVNEGALGLDALPSQEILRRLADAQLQAAAAVRPAIPAIARAADLVANRLATGGRLVYAAAGSSALMAMADALELPGTFGIPRERIAVLIAGGSRALTDLAGAPEDDGLAATAEVRALGLGADDCLIAISASGSTPYAVAALDAARARGAATIGIASNAGRPLVERADIAVVLATPPEMIAGSTRMGAGTAQKIALNMLSTLAATHLGHVHDGYMVNLKADNMKLRDRAARIVAAIAGCETAEAVRLLEKTGGAVKPAVLIATGARDRGDAERLLAETGDRLRPALARLEEGSLRSRHNGT